MKSINCFLIFFLFIPAIAQENNRAASKFQNDILLQFELGSGVSFYSMKSEQDIIGDLSKTVDLSGNEMGNGLGFGVGGSLFFPAYGLRFRLFYRGEEYSNKNTNFFTSALNTIFFREVPTDKFDLIHSISTTTIGLEKLYSTEPNYQGLLYGFGGFYGFVSDDRKEQLVLLENSREVKINNSITIDADVAGFNLILGKYFTNNVFYVEFRPGYQFQIQSKVNTDRRPGKSTEGLKPEFSGFFTYLTLGFTI